MIGFKTLFLVTAIVFSVCGELQIQDTPVEAVVDNVEYASPEGLLSIDAQQGHENEGLRKARQFGGGYGGGYGGGFGGGFGVGFGGGYGGGFGGGYGGGYGGGFGGGYGGGGFRGGYAQRYRYRERYRFRQRHRQRFGYGGFYG